MVIGGGSKVSKVVACRMHAIEERRDGRWDGLHPSSRYGRIGHFIVENKKKRPRMVWFRDSFM